MILLFSKSSLNSIFTLKYINIKMKKSLCYISVILLWSLVNTSCKNKDNPSPIIIEDSITTLTVKITKIETLQGALHVGLYNSEASWNKDVVDNEGGNGGNEFIIKREETKTREQNIVFDSIPAGTYGTSLYQDLDNNGSLNRDAILNLLPIEPYGFSNNVVPSTGPPKFEKCSFVVEDKKSITITIDLNGS